MRGILFLSKNYIQGKKKYNNGVIAKYFIPGEEPEGWVLGSTEEKKQKNRESALKQWKDPEFLEYIKEVYSTDEFHEMRSNAARKGWLNSDVEARRESNRQSHIEYYKDPNHRDAARQRMIKKWQESEYHTNQTKALQRSHENIYQKHPEYLSTVSEGNLRTWNERRQEILYKQYQTKKKNGSFNTSKPEDILYEELCLEYGQDNVIRQYRMDERYPFYCDFYIPSEDLFIELNAHWTHGGRPYDPEDEFCQKQLKDWQEKAKTSSYYQGAIDNWTKGDVKKLETAKKNNLNIKIIY